MVKPIIKNNKVHLSKFLSSNISQCEKNISNDHKDKKLVEEPITIENLKFKVKIDTDYSICEECFDRNKKSKKRIRNLIIFYVVSCVVIFSYVFFVKFNLL